MYKFQLEKGSKKHKCPACGEKRFVRYIDAQTNRYLNSDVGRCDRESSCGNHKTPKEYFAENENLRKPNIQQTATRKKRQAARQITNVKNGSQSVKTPKSITASKVSFNVIPTQYLLDTLGNYEQNNFVQFLTDLYPIDFEAVQDVIKNYQVGTTPDGKTVFWQIDKQSRIRAGKIIAYDRKTGKRIKSIYPNWIHAVLKKQRSVSDNFNLKQCFFGEHLLRSNNQNPVAIVEAEKTAVICSIVFPEKTWLATGSKQNLNLTRIQQIQRRRKIILYPDADGFAVWSKKAQEARSKGFDVTISNLIQMQADDAERSDGVDIADYLIAGQSRNNAINEKLEVVRNDPQLRNKFETLLDEQKANLMTDNQHSNLEAEKIVTMPENVRKTALSLV